MTEQEERKETITQKLPVLNTVKPARGCITDENHKAPSCNVTIKCSNEEFSISRDKLCRYSERLRLTSQDVEPGQDWEINMNGVPKETLQKLLEFVEKNGDIKVFSSLFPGSIINLISLAHSLEMKAVETSLFTVILEGPSCYTFLTYLWDLAQQLKNLSAIGNIVRFTHQRLNEVVSRGIYKDMTWDQVLQLMDGAVRDRPYDELCAAIILWLKQDRLKRDHALTVAQHLDWNRLSSDFICKCLFTEPLFRRILKLTYVHKLWNLPPILVSALCQFKKFRHHTLALEKPGLTKQVEGELIRSNFLMAWANNVLIDRFNPPCKYGFCSQEHTVRRPALLIVGTTRFNSLAYQVYKVKSRTWLLPVDIFLQHRRDLGCTYHKGKLYLVGGDRGDNQVYATCFSVNISNGAIKELVDMRHGKSHFGMAVKEEELYVLGGLNERQKAVSAVNKYPTNSTYELWKPVHPMKEKRWSPGVTVIPYSQIFVIGGHSCCCEYYHCQKWFDMEPLPKKYRDYGMHAIYMKERIYAFRNKIPFEICVFDPIRGGLKIFPTRGAFPECVASACCFGTEIWALTPKGRLYTYCVTSKLWKRTELKCGGLNHCCFVTIVDEDELGEYATKKQP